MALVTSNFNTPPFKKFTLANVLNYNSARVHPALLCANHTEQGKYTGQMQAARQKQKPGHLFIERARAQCFVPLAAVNPEAIHVCCCAENGADAVVLQSVDQSVLQRCRLSRQNNVGQISLANIRNMPRRLRGLKNLAELLLKLDITRAM